MINLSENVDNLSFYEKKSDITMDNKKQKKFTLPAISKFEQNVLSFIQQHLLMIAMFAVTALALIIRFMLRENVSGDAYYYLLPWYDTIKAGGFKSLSQPVGNYGILYQFCITLFTVLPMKPLYTYKLFSVIFDFLLAAFGMHVIMKHETSHRELKGVLMYAAVLLSPIVFLNSAYWAQCDVIYTYFCVLSVYEMYRDKYLPSMILFGVAITFKLQAIFVLPFLLFCYLYKKRFSILYFLMIPVTMIALSLPGIVMGRGVFEVFTIYFEQTTTYQQMTMNYPSFWTLFQNASLDEFYQKFHTAATLLTVAVLGVYMVLWIKKKIPLNLRNSFSMAFIISYTCVLFLPAMHERYGFIYEILAIFLAFWYYKTIPMLVLMYFTTFGTYSHFLFAYGIDSVRLAWFNVLVYVVYVIYLHKQMFKTAESDDAPKLSQPAKA